MAHSAEYHREWYEKNKGRRRPQIYASKQRSADRLRVLLAARKQAGCSRCSESDPACLDLHHIEPATKRFDVGWALTRGYSEQTFTEELDKCIVLCSNCHRKLHSQ